MNASTVLAEAGAIAGAGLQKLGYEYVNLDDCVMNYTRDPQTHRLQPDAVKFGGESGIKALAAALHARGFKFGMYTDRGSQTCMHRAGSRHYEAVDAQAFAEWGVDFLKEDSCAAYQNPDKAIPEYGPSRAPPPNRSHRNGH